MTNVNYFNSYKSASKTQLRWLLWRNILAIFRDKSNNMILLIQCVFMGLIYGLIFYKTDINQEGVQNINSLFFLLIIYVSGIHMYFVTSVNFLLIFIIYWI
jgi:hypothetical protein